MGKLTLGALTEVIWQDDAWHGTRAQATVAARAVLALLERKAETRSNDEVDCDLCGAPRPRCPSVNSSGVRCDKSSGESHSYHLGSNCEQPDGKPDPAPVASETNKPRTCNRHNDCGAANAKARAAGRYGADHCHDENCEDCFGT